MNSLPYIIIKNGKGGIIELRRARRTHLVVVVVVVGYFGRGTCILSHGRVGELTII